MPQIKKHNFSPNTITLDMKNHPDADAMLKIAKSIKGVKIKTVKSGQFVTIHYPATQEHFRLRISVKHPKTFWDNLETGFVQLSRKKPSIHLEKSKDESGTRLYHAMILK